jgi:tRNA threonylcarbamoyladenosine biosynthesis protein TsaE
MSGPKRVAPPTGEWATASEEETQRLGEQFGGSLVGGETVLLDGPLGAGKTIFVKGVAAALGIDEEEVTSPSFTLVNRYEGESLTLYHLDLYRLPEGSTAAHAVDLDDLLTDTTASIIIEWGARLGPYRLPSPVWRVSIAGDGEEPRRITISQDER